MKLVIAEKPSVAQSLAAVIGATARKNGYLEGNGWRVSWCVGHLAGLADADSYDPKYAKWRYDDLPILPEHWQMVVGKDKKKQFDILKKLMNAPDVTEVVNACDAGCCPLPCQGGLAGGDQCHKAVFRAVPPHTQHRARYVPNAGTHCPARS